MRLFVTGSNSSLVRGMISNLPNIDIIPIESLTNSDSNKMEFEIDFLNTFKPNDFLLHCAWNMKERNMIKSRKINVDGSINLFNSLDQKQKNNFIFISSRSAMHNSQSVYGKHKYEVERYILKQKGKVLKLGILYDEDEEDALHFLNDLKSLIKNFPIIPNFSGNKKIYKVTRKEQLIDYFNNNLSSSSNLFEAYDEKDYAFKDLVRTLLKSKKPIVNFPFYLGYYSLKLVRTFMPNYKLDFDSFLYIKTMIERKSNE